MGKEPGVPNGTGPNKRSYRRRVEGKTVGRRMEREGKCVKNPSKKK